MFAGKDCILRGALTSDPLYSRGISQMKAGELGH